MPIQSKPSPTEQALAQVQLPNQLLRKIPYAKWELLAYDIALDNLPQEAIADAYNIGVEDIQMLKSHPHFLGLIEEKTQEIEQIQAGGGVPSFAIQMRIIAERVIPHLYARLTNSETSNKDFQALYRLVTELASLQPQANKSNASSSSGSGGGLNVIFNIEGVPDLGHLALTPKQSQTTTTPTTTQQATRVIDATAYSTEDTADLISDALHASFTNTN